METFLQALGGSEEFMPHGMCYLWEPDLLWTHVAADTLTWLSYWAIPPFLVYLVWRGRTVVPENAPYQARDLPHAWVFWAFGIFIVACGTTHLMAVWTVWEPVYWLSGGVKVLTAVASVATAVALPPLIPKALTLLKDARESELRRLELEEANQELEGLYHQLREYDRLKTEFFANVSHELRTPLTLILGPVEELLDTAELGTVGRRKLATVRSNARSLLGHVNDLLDMAQLEAGSALVEPVQVDVARLVRTVAGHFRELADTRGVDLVVEAPESLGATLDARKVERILLNLLSNAFKFTPEGGTVRVQLRERQGGAGAADQPGRLALVVADSGPGVPPDERKRVFERFRRVDGAGESPFQGTGLGLAIASEFARAMGGVVTVGDAPEGGALFTVVLPAPPPEGPGTQDLAPGVGLSAGVTETEVSRVWTRLSPGPDRRGSPLGREDADATILVVEDNPELCEYLADVLGSEHRIYVARDGASGLEEAARVGPDLIVTDIMMPGMGGQEMIEELRTREEHRHTPILVLTARTEPAMPARLLESGAQDYLMKPVRVDELKARVRNLLELTRTRRILARETDSEEGQGLDELAGKLAAGRKELQRTVDEKEALLRELQHRVKGNLQTILSMLNLQVRKVSGSGARGALENAQGRVAAMGLVHEGLYGSDQPVGLRLGPYLERLAATTRRSHGPPGNRVTVEVACQEITLAVDKATPCGLLVYELLTNALRHAFPDSREGRVEVRCVQEDGRVILEVEDDGVGLPGDEAHRRGMGLDLVEGLVRQLQGEMETEHRGGTLFRIAFPLGEGS